MGSTPNVAGYQYYELPIDSDNEALIIANAIHDSDHRNTFAKKLQHIDFRHEEYQTLAWGILQIQKEELAMDIDTLRLKANTSPVRKLVSVEFIQTLLDTFTVVPAPNYDTHLDKLKLDKVKSEVATLCMNSLYKSCLSPDMSLDQVYERGQHIIKVLEKGYSSSQSQFKTMEEVAADFVYARDNLANFYTTGFKELDAKLTEGYAPGKISIICGLSGMGKSSLVLSSMKNLANLGIYTAQFALEMNNISIFTKLLAYNTRLAVQKLTKFYTQLDPKEKQLYDFELDRLAKNKFLLLNDKPGQSLSEIREQTMILQDRFQQSYWWLAIDLFGKIADFQSSDNFARAYEQKLNIIQPMAREQGVNYGLVAQINRAVNNRKFNRPKMSDLKNAGALEEVADLILGVHRPFYNPEKALQLQITYDEYSDETENNNIDDDDPNKNIAEVIILKQRMGESNILVNFFFDPETTAYNPIANDYQNIINASKTDLDEDYS